MTKSGHEHLAQVCAANVPRLAPFAASLRDGSTAPDTMFGHRGTRHHDLHLKIRKYKHLSRSARISLLCGRGASAAFQLGLLLHYVADGAIGVPGSAPGHTAYETAVQRQLRRLPAPVPEGVGGCRSTWWPEAAAPRANWLGRYTTPEPAVAADRALRVSCRLAHAVFGPSFHPDDTARAACLRERRRACDEQLPALLRVEGGSWRTPWAGIVGVVVAVAVALGRWVGRGFWFWPAFGLDRNDAAHAGYFACCAASLAGLALVGPGCPSLPFGVWAVSSALTFFLWAWAVTAHARITPRLRRFWIIAATVLGPLAPVALSALGLAMGLTAHRTTTS